MGKWEDDAIHHKYDPLPDEPRFRGKRKRKRHVRSDHKHDYERVCIDAHTATHTRDGVFPSFHIGVRCKVCGRLHNIKFWQFMREPPSDMPLYEVKDFFELIEMRTLPNENEVTRRDGE